MQSPGDEPDVYAKGMVHYGQAESEATPTYDKWQYGLFKGMLGRKILEVGAGSGRITACLMQDADFDELVAAEPSLHFYSLLQGNLRPHPKLKLLQLTTGELLSDYRGHFDTVFSVHVLEHIEDDFGALAEQLELTRAGGRLIVLVPALSFLYSELDRNIGHFRRYDKGRFRELVQRLGNCKTEKIFYSNALGVLGSLYFSKIRKINYQGTDANRKKFFRLYRFFSEYAVPAISFVEYGVPVPFGLNLTAVFRKI